MKRMSLKVLKNLEHIQKDINVTMYLPVLAGPQNTSANISTLHHAVSSLKTVLNDAEIPKSKQQQVLKDVNKLDQELGHPMSGKSLAIFISNAGIVNSYELPFVTEATIYVMASGIQLGPIKAHYSDSLSYWVLSLSQNGCSLFKGSRDKLKKVADAELQKDLTTSLMLDEVGNKELQTHQVRSAGQRGSESFHGHGGFKDMHKKYLEDYLRKIDKHLSKYSLNANEPIYLVGVDYVQSMYKKISSRKTVLVSGLNINAKYPTIQNISTIVLPKVPKLATQPIRY